MKQVSRLAATTIALLAAACMSDRASAPVTGPDGTPIARATATSTEATPLNMTIFPNEIVGGGSTSATGRVNVADTAVNFDRVMQVTSNNPSVMPFLSTGTVVAAGTTFGAVQLDPATVSQRTVVTISVTGNGATVSADLIVDPPGTAIAPTLSSFTVSPSTVDAGTTSTGTVTIPSPAPAGGVVVSLGSRLPGSASVPPSVTVAQGATTASFPITTFAGFPNSTNSVLLEANTANTLIQSSITVVTGGTTATPSLFSLTLGSTSVTGGTSTVGTVALTAPAPSGGSVVSLASSNGAAATPSSVTVPAGASSASFTITTKAVSSTTTANISATFGGGSLSTPLTVNPSSTTSTSTSLAAPALLAPSADQRFAPGTNVTFDWSDVTNAASYEIQIDDKDTFPSPLILDRTVTASQLSISTLPTSTMFWRVRAIAASGATGAWSSVRRFEIKQ